MQLEKETNTMPVTQLFENHRVRVSNFVLPPGERWPCTHPHNTVRWQVGEALLRKDGDEAAGQVPDKSVSFIKQGTEFTLTNASSTIDSREIVFELKQPPKYTQAEVDDLLARAIYPTNVGTELLLENEYCRVWDFYLEPDEGDPSTNAHHHVLDYVFVYVAPGRLLGYHPDGRPGLFDSINDDNDVEWFDIPAQAPELVEYAHAGKNGYKDKPMREYLVELK